MKRYEELPVIGDNARLLPRGGYLVDTPIGYVQFGSPPETIKDTMFFEKGVPTIFVLPAKLFNWIKGISVAEIEFPVYYNFFIKKRKTLIICTKEQLKQIKRVLQESLFGPRNLNLASDFHESDEASIPNLKKEMNFFRNKLRLSDLITFGIFQNGNFLYENLRIEINENNSFSVYYGKSRIAQVPGEITYVPTYLIGERLPEPYVPPLFSITCLGPSHGFDPHENTSGFIIWLNHQGIMVDPPVNATEWLEDSNVNPKLIDSIILTHCHADHDAGTFQKILEEGKVTIFTTETIMMSFLRKYSSLSGMSIAYLMKLFDFHPVKIGQPLFIHNAKFTMFYTLHSIPTIGFKMEFQDQSFVYSSDHNNDPEVHRKLYEEGIINKNRYEELRNFPWNSKVIYHEAGIPPLHTPVKYLDSLPDDVKKRIVVYHIAQKDFPQNTLLRLAKFGIENTLTFETAHPHYEASWKILGLLKHQDFFHDLPIHKAQEFVAIVQEERYKKGDVIIRKGTKGDKFYIIYSGNVSVESGNLTQRKIYGTYDYFGEVALVTEQNRAADVIAETDVTLYSIPRDKFLNFIVGTEFEKVLRKLALIRNSETWNLLSTSPFFRLCTASQKTWLESMFIPEERHGSGIILREGRPIRFMYIIRHGEVIVSKKEKHIAVLKKGDFIETLMNVYSGKPAQYTYFHTDTVFLYALPREEMRRFAEKNPGLLMKLTYNFSK
ncbi:MAG: cAMP/cGMP-dependent 3',5'-cyclic-AMP/GMP phosphodiesterase [Spirochaetes bacterium]|nr:cAMP/cGMP-dependent 3',5'-cyclic-AMP/GMP phosphodiesterase [Spirochaetota bacterium]